MPVAETRAFGCTTKWLSKASGVEQEWARIQAEPVTVDLVGAEELKALRANATDKVMLVQLLVDRLRAPAPSQFLDLETTYRMYRQRAFDLVTVIDRSRRATSAAVLAFLKKQYASSPNKQFATADRAGLQAAWGVKWNLGAPLTMVIAPGGEVLYQKEGKIDILEVRRAILAAMPDTRGYIGSKAYSDGFAGGRQEGTKVAVEGPALSGVEGACPERSRRARVRVFQILDIERQPLDSSAHFFASSDRRMSRRSAARRSPQADRRRA